MLESNVIGSAFRISGYRYVYAIEQSTVYSPRARVVPLEGAGLPDGKEEMQKKSMKGRRWASE